jgi:hypothetical protein
VRFALVSSARSIEHAKSSTDQPSDPVSFAVKPLRFLDLQVGPSAVKAFLRLGPVFFVLARKL